MKRSAFTLIELITVVGVVLVMIIALAPFVEMAKARAGRIECANNLKKISLGLHAYASEHYEKYPQDLAALYPNYVETEKVFDCPVSKARGTKDKPDYEYVSGLTEASSPKSVIAQDSDGNHKSSGRNILRVDGSVEWTH